MKVRKGFVSNSSSSSFIILGIHYDEDDVMELINSLLSVPSIKEKFEKDNELVENYDEDALEEVFLEWFEYDFIDKYNFFLDTYDFCVKRMEDNSVYIGAEISRIEDEVLEESSISLDEINKLTDKIIDTLHVDKSQIGLHFDNTGY